MLSKNKDILRDSIVWDRQNWGFLINYIEQNINIDKVNSALELGVGDSGGGLSLYLASKDVKVVCSDVKDVSKNVIDCHKKYPFSINIGYDIVDAKTMDSKDKFDLIIFKSMLGISCNNYKESKAIFSQIYQSLNVGGYLVFAENIRSTPLHMFIRNRLGWGKNHSGWNYFSYQELNSLCEQNFSDYKLKTKGFVGCFGRSENQKNLLGYLDSCIFNFIIPKQYKYICFGICKK